MAIEKNSRGRYRFVDNLAAQDESSYYDHLNISSVNTKTVTMPSVFQDVLRDLLANARKYTPPGGRISGGLFDSGEELRFVVEDNGMGIAEDEILKVIGYGARASNAQGKKTLGGGYGLTKAYYYTKAYGGRFWVDSQLGQGTRIEIRIPKSA
jgi:signal transduction histidine kinase